MSEPAVGGGGAQKMSVVLALSGAMVIVTLLPGYHIMFKPASNMPAPVQHMRVSEQGRAEHMAPHASGQACVLRRA